MSTAQNEPKVREVHPGIFLIHLPLPMKPTIVNVYLVNGGSEWALVDTGINSTDSKAAFRAALDAAGCPPERLRKIICTHHHPDHFGASQAFKELTGAELLMHREEFERSKSFAPRERPPEAVQFFLSNGIPLRRFTSMPRMADFWQGLYAPDQPDIFLEDGDIVAVGDRKVEVVWTPGHAPGHCVFYLPEERVMIVGDHLLPKITPHVGFAPGSVENPLGDFLASQQKVQRFAVDLVLPAHGGVFPDHVRRANQIIQHHRYRLEEVLDAVRREPHTGYDVARRVFAFDFDSPLTYQFPATFETLAHLEHLRHEGKVARDEQDDQILYRAA